MGHFAESEQLFASPFKTLIPAPLFSAHFFGSSLQSRPYLNSGPLFPALVQSPPNRPTPLPSQEVSEVSEEKLVAAKRGATMPGVGATILPPPPQRVYTKYGFICIM